MLEFNFFKLVNAAPPSCKIPPGRARWGLLSVVISGFIVAILYLMHLMCCQFSAMRFFDMAYTNSDMHANLLWAQGIREQGWLNPSPFHPYNYWMQPMAPYSQWVQWWGGEQIFQQSPLYAYLLALLLPKLILMRLLQAVMSMGTCAFLGLLTARITGRLAGWIAFWLAALYAPFYAYSWPFLQRIGMVYYCGFVVGADGINTQRLVFKARATTWLDSWSVAGFRFSDKRNLSSVNSNRVGGACFFCAKATNENCRCPKRNRRFTGCFAFAHSKLLCPCSAALHLKPVC